LHSVTYLFKKFPGEKKKKKIDKKREGEKKKSNERVVIPAQCLPGKK